MYRDMEPGKRGRQRTGMETRNEQGKALFWELAAWKRVSKEAPKNAEMCMMYVTLTQHMMSESNSITQRERNSIEWNTAFTMQCGPRYRNTARVS